MIRDKAGNFGILTALGALPVIAACGAGLDFATAHSKRTELQSVADAAVLFAASSGERDATKLKQIARNVFASMANNQFGATPVIESVDLDNDDHITMKVSAVVPLSIAKIIRPEGVKIAALSQALMGSDDKIEVALVLDNTFSMYGQKLTDLKLASNALLDVFDKADKKRERVRISITPFAQYVNVGVANRGKKWLTVADDKSTTTSSCKMQKPLISQTCTTSPATTTIDGVTVPTTKTTCTNQVYGPEKEVCSTNTSTTKWNGCVGSRTNPLNVLDSQVTKTYPGLMDTTCTNPITQLTNDYKALRAAITAMTVSTGGPFQQTYIPQGIMWGWNTINPTEPFDDALSYDDDVRKFIVIMTDGANTVRPQDTNYAQHTAKDNLTKADKFVEDVCTNAKAASTKNPIVIFTVAVGIDKDSTTAAALTKCASDNSRTYTATDSATLATVFSNIASQILVARLTK